MSNKEELEDNILSGLNEIEADIERLADTDTTMAKIVGLLYQHEADIRAKPAAQNDEAKAALDEFIYACEKGMEIRKLTKFCRSQISQALQQTPPDGYVLVPVEPTSEMIIAADEKAFGKSCDHIYKAMIAAATKEIPAKEGE